MVYECFCNGIAASKKVFFHIYSMDRQACHCSEMAVDGCSFYGISSSKEGQ